MLVAYVLLNFYSLHEIIFVVCNYFKLECTAIVGIQPVVQIIGINTRTGSAREATFQCVSSMLLTSCLFQQAVLSNHGQFQLDLHPFIEWYLYFMEIHVCSRLGAVQAASVNIAGCNLLDTPAHKPCTNILFPQVRHWRPLYRWVACKSLHKICGNGLFPLHSTWSVVVRLTSREQKKEAISPTNNYFFS